MKTGNFILYATLYIRNTLHFKETQTKTKHQIFLELILCRITTILKDLKKLLTRVMPLGGDWT